MKGWILILILFFCMVIGFSIGKLTTKNQPTELVLPNVSRETDLIDSLKRRFKADSAMIITLQKEKDSLKLLRVVNHKTLNNGIKTIKGFSRIKRNSYLDSIYGADSK